MMEQQLQIILFLASIYLVVLIFLCIHYAIYFRYWAKKFEYKIRAERMSIHEFHSWITTEFCLWPFKLKELCGH